MSAAVFASVASSSLSSSAGSSMFASSPTSNMRFWSRIDRCRSIPKVHIINYTYIFFLTSAVVRSAVFACVATSFLSSSASSSVSSSSSTNGCGRGCDMRMKTRHFIYYDYILFFFNLKDITSA